MSAIAEGARVDLGVRSPNPGLRPFLESESSFYFGRNSQRDEVIRRLCDSRFVAVIGGSGSGKSSLIQAGVIPELRRYRIREAGDCWIPVVSTPGTDSAKADTPNARADTPINRLARKFVAVLRFDTNEQRSSARSHVERLLREPNGISQIINEYRERLDLPPGPDPLKANFIFVLDQFEELFHPSNENVPDCRVLVDRVLDHFDSPHPRAYLVLTMRSEHLNDCAAYLRLPDAINKASYLIRRLDDVEIDQAILRPINRFLRIYARVAAGRGPVATKFEFDNGVLKRLQDDVQAIHSDPDHLPLLQHLLARLWDMACARSRIAGLGIPVRIMPEDMHRAVSAKAEWEGPFPENFGEVNVLRASLENWAQQLYRRLRRGDREGLDRLLRQLAFKDPNTGTYTQQRLDVSAAISLLGGGATADGVRNLIAGFREPFDYLYWDDENSERITIKVSHESFIRGWRHFRDLIDFEAERFDEFVALAKASARQNDGATTSTFGDMFYLQGAQLARVRAFDLRGHLADGRCSEALYRLLDLKRGGEQFRQSPQRLIEFLDASEGAETAEIKLREAEREATEAARIARIRAEEEAKSAEARAQASLALAKQIQAENARMEAEARDAQARIQMTAAIAEREKVERERAEADKRATAALLGEQIAQTEKVEEERKRLSERTRKTVAVVVLLSLVLGYLIPTVLFFSLIYIPVTEHANAMFGLYTEAGKLSPPHALTSDATGAVVKSMSKVSNTLDSNRLTSADEWISRLKMLPIVAAQGERLWRQNFVVDRLVNDKLRYVLQNGVWSVANQLGEGRPAPLLVSRPVDAKCQIGEGSTQSGYLYSNDDRGVFVSSNFDQIELRSVNVLKEKCSASTRLGSFYSVAAFNEAVVVVDRDLRYLVQVSRASGVSQVLAFEIKWNREEKDWRATVRLISRVPRPGIAGTSQGQSGLKPIAFGPVELAGAETQSLIGSAILKVGESRIRLFSDQGDVIPTDDRSAFDVLGAMESGSVCESAKARVSQFAQAKVGKVSGWRSKAHPDHCFFSAALLQEGTQKESDRVPVMVSIFAKPVPGRDNEPPVSQMFLVVRKNGDWRLLVGKDKSKFDGWVAIGDDKGSSDLIGAPWSTSALARLVKELQ